MPDFVINKLTVSNTTQERFHQIAEYVMTGGADFSFNCVIPMPRELDVIDDHRCAQFEEMYWKFCGPESRWSDVLNISKQEYEKIRMTPIMERNLSAMGFRPMTNSEVTTEERAILEMRFQMSRARMDNVSPLAYGHRLIMNRLIFGAPTWHGWRIAHWGTKWDAISSEVLPAGFGWSFSTVMMPCDPIVKALSVIFPEAEFTLEHADEEGEGLGCGVVKYQNGDIIDLITLSDGSREAIQFARDICEEERSGL